MNIWISIILLALVQGATEFLPVSSSGHLTVLGKLLGMDLESNLTLGIMLHAGSLIAILVFYFRTWWEILTQLRWRMMLLLIVGCIPAGIAGVVLKQNGWYDRCCSDLCLVGISFLVTGALLRLTANPRLFALKPGEVPAKFERMSFRQALTVGVVQIAALLPGISRSGSTISAGILSGVEREAAAKFSFIMAIPLIGGAAALETLHLVKSGTVTAELSPIQILFAVALSAVASFGALKLLVNIVRRGKLAWFSWYLYAVGTAVLAWQLWEKIHA